MLTYPSCRHIKYNLDHGPSEPLSGPVFQCFDLLMTLFKALADVPVGSVRAVKATRTVSNSVIEKNAGEPFSMGVRAVDGKPSTEREPGSSNTLRRALTVPTSPSTDPLVLDNLNRQRSAPVRHEEEEESDNGLETELEIVELPGEPVQEAYLSQPSSTSYIESEITDRQNSNFENDQSSIRTSNTQTGLKYAGNAIKGTGLGLSKSVSRLTVAGFKAPLDAFSTLAYGFHNVPKLWGDDIRPPDRITGARSGLKAAGKVCTRHWMNLESNELMQ